MTQAGKAYFGKAHERSDDRRGLLSFCGREGLQVLCSSFTGGLLAVLLVAALAGCQKDAGSSGTVIPPLVDDLTPPTLVDFSPSSCARDIPVDTVITATFSETIDCSSVTWQTFNARDWISIIGTTIACDGNQVTLTPMASLQNSAGYTVTITTGVRDLAGNALAQEHSWWFVVGPDAIAPIVVSASPMNFEQAVPVDAAIKVTFSEPMNSSTIDASTFMVNGVAGTVTYYSYDNSATFHPAADLSANTTYHATIAKGITDSEGNAMSADTSWSFTTAASDVVTGLLDTTFGRAGVMTHHNAAGGNGYDWGSAAAVDSSGRILVTGGSIRSEYSWYSDMTTWRLNPDGTLDATFNGNGYVTHRGDGSEFSRVYGVDVAIDASNRILVVGTDGYKMVLWRYNPDGSLDTTFNGIGYAMHSASSWMYDHAGGQALVLESSGKIVVAGYRIRGVAHDDFSEYVYSMVLWRFNGDGTADTTFNGTGYVVYDDPRGKYASAWGNDVAMDQSGRIVVLGGCDNGVSGYTDMAIWKYTSEGKLDTTFNGVGYLTYNHDAEGKGRDEGCSVAVDASGRILVAGLRQSYGAGSWTSEMAVWRYASEGVLDTTFNDTGYVTHRGASSGTGNAWGISLAIDENGHIVVAGGSGGSAYRGLDMTVWRYRDDGTLDAGFYGSGYVTHNNAAGGHSDDVGEGMAFDSSGRILVTGYSTNVNRDLDMAVWRIQ